jgi:hypothetical protein
MPNTPISNATYQQALDTTLRLLTTDPSAITTSQAAFLRQNADPRDERTAAIITAIEALASANQTLWQTAGTNVASELKSAVDEKDVGGMPEVVENV